MGQNDPYHTDDLSVTKNESVTFNRSTWYGSKVSTPHRWIICNALSNPSGHRVHVDIPPANAVAGLYISRSQTQITKRKEAEQTRSDRLPIKKINFGGKPIERKQRHFERKRHHPPHREHDLQAEGFLQRNRKRNDGG